MKKTILSLLALATISFVSAQTTFDLDWEPGVNGGAASFTVEPGDTVRWTWADGLPHSVTSLPGSTENFDSGIQTGMGTQFSFTFNAEGTNDYQCDVHPATMFGTITVMEILSVQDKFEQNVQLFPNPVDTELTIISLYRLDNYEIYDIHGKRVGQGLGEGTYTHLNTSYLNSGIYFVRVKSDDLQATLRLIKK